MIFIGVFLFSFLGLIVLNVKFFSEFGKVVFYFFIIVVVLLVVIVFICWIGYFMLFGCMDYMLDKVEIVVCDVFVVWLVMFYFGGCVFDGFVLLGFIEVFVFVIGYIEYVDMLVL